MSSRLKKTFHPLLSKPLRKITNNVIRTPLFIFIHRYQDVILAVVVFLTAAAYYSYISIIKFLKFNAFAYDLGIYAQTSYLISHFQMPFSTVRGLNQFGDHFSPTYILLSLPYSLFNSPLYLLVMQIASIILGGIPIYLIAKQILKSRYAPYLLVVAYFLQIGLIQALRFDFHLAALSVGFVSWTIYFWHRDRFWPFVVLMLLSILTKEDITILFSFFALFLFVSRKYKYAFVTIGCSVGWYLLTTKVIMPYFLGQPYGYNNISDFFAQWDIKQTTMDYTFRQNLYLALGHPIGWVFAGANFLTRFLSQAQNRWTLDWHYGANIAAPLLISTILTLKRFKTKQTVEVLSVYILAATLYFGWPFTNRYYPRTVRSQVMQEMVQKIPNSASVSAQDVFVPHLANRKEIYLFPEGRHSQYVVLSPEVPSFPVTKTAITQTIEFLKHNPNYSLSEKDNVYVFKRLPKENK